MSTPAVETSADEAANRSRTRRGWLLDEAASLVLPVVMPVVRRLHTVVLVVCALMTTICAFVLIAAARDDAAIASNSVVTSAEVLAGSSYSRTLIRFTTDDGKLMVPEKGVYYPRGLRPGQIVRVEYDRTHPDRVRLLGRSVRVGVLPVCLVALGTWVTLLPLAHWLRRRRPRTGR